MALKVNCALPLKRIDNVAFVRYGYSTQPGVVDKSVSGLTNVVSTDLVFVYTQKHANKSFVDIGDNIMFTIDVVNNSTISVSNLVFYDTVPAGTTLVPDSFYVSGYGNIPGANPTDGVDLSTIVGILGPNTTCSVSFNVIFNSVP